MIRLIDLIEYEKREKVRNRILHKQFEKYLPAKESRRDDECWNWKGGTRRGYGEIKHHGKRLVAHRLSYEFHIGEIPDGLIIRHTCDNPLCVNPKHLLPGTHLENVADMVKRNRCATGNRKLKVYEIKDIKYQLIKNKNPGIGVQLAQIYAVSTSTISQINKNRIWKSIESKELML